MGFYDRDKALKGMGQARENMSNIIAQAVNANSQANDNIAKAVGSLSQDIGKAVGGYLKQEADLKKDLERKDALVSALEKGGASKEIIEAAKSAKKSDDILPLVGVIANPKNIVETKHSYGQVNVKDLFRGTEKDIGTSYAGIFGKGGGGGNSKTSTLVPSSIQGIFNSNQELTNNALSAGLITLDENKNVRTKDYGNLVNFIAADLANQEKKRIKDESIVMQKKIKKDNEESKKMVEDDLKKIEISKKIWGY